MLVVATLAACAPRHGSAFVVPYDVAPRALLPAALDATRDMHYAVAAIESEDAAHASFLALDGVRDHAQTALLVQLGGPTSYRNRVRLRNQPTDLQGLPAIRVVVTPMAFRDGRELPDAEVPAETRADAERLMYAIYDRARDERRF